MPCPGSDILDQSNVRAPVRRENLSDGEYQPMAIVRYIRPTWPVIWSSDSGPRTAWKGAHSFHLIRLARYLLASDGLIQTKGFSPESLFRSFAGDGALVCLTDELTFSKKGPLHFIFFFSL